MISTATLTSLAILRVNVNRGNDYFDYLRPFILQVLIEHKPEPVTAKVVNKHILTQFGLKIPEQTVKMVLKRISRYNYLKKESGIYRITNDLPDPHIITKMSRAERHIQAIVYGLQQFSQDTAKVITNPKDAVVAICAFLSEFDVTCLRAYLQGTAIPKLKANHLHRSNIVLVSDYIQHLQRTDPERFESFLVLVQGHMLANALLCPDLKNISSTFSKVTFYLDTPLLVRILGLEGESKQNASCGLIDLIKKLGGKLAVFSHTYQELQNVLRGAADHVGSPNGRGPIVLEAKKAGTTRVDLLHLAIMVEEKLDDFDIKIENTPRYIEDFQIDETVFEQVLEDEIKYYYNPRAKEYDINSVRSIYTIRENKFAPSLEKSRAIFVTSNTAFAEAAWKYGKQYESAQDVSVVISDFSLANLAWLKAPMEAPSIPKTQLLALSYAALEPSSSLLDAYLAEVDKLEKQGTITVRDHQLLRSSRLAYTELMHLTLGDDAAFTAETVTQTLERVSKEIKQEEMVKFQEEKTAHHKTQGILKSQIIYNQKIKERIYSKCRNKAKIIAWLLSGGTMILLFIGLLSGLGLFSKFGFNPTPRFSWLLAVGSTVLILFTFMNLVIGSSVKKFHTSVENKCFDWFLWRESKTMGIDLSNSDAYK